MLRGNIKFFGILLFCIFFSVAAHASPFAYITNSVGGNVSVINTATNTVSATVHVGTSPYGVAVTPDGSRVYVANSGGSNVSVINTATNTVTATVSVGTSPRAFGLFITSAIVSRAAAPAAVPTMSEWGMIIFMVIAGCRAMSYLRRRRRA